jgi:hypothetical protein
MIFTADLHNKWEGSDERKSDIIFLQKIYKIK